MSPYWLIIVGDFSETLLTFSYAQDVVLFLHGKDNLARFRIVKNKGSYVVEVHIKHLPREQWQSALEAS